MNENWFGHASCNRISHDNTSATSPMPMAVHAYCTAMILAS